MGDKVSIVITTYKGREILKNAIKSALNQTYRNIEIIVIDDNGNNEENRKKTENIMKEFEGNNIIYIQNKRRDENGKFN